MVFGVVVEQFDRRQALPARKTGLGEQAPRSGKVARQPRGRHIIRQPGRRDRRGGLLTAAENSRDDGRAIHALRQGAAHALISQRSHETT